MVTVYSKPGCQPCRLVKMRLEKNDVEFEVKDITEDPAALAHVEFLGYKSVPVVQWENAEGTIGGHFGGYAPDKIDDIRI